MEHDDFCPCSAAGWPDPEACLCPLIAKVVARERWIIGSAIATQEALVADRIKAQGYDAYDEGARDAYDRSEQIASSGGRLVTGA